MKKIKQKEIRMKTGKIKTTKIKQLKKGDWIAFWICFGITIIRVILSLQGLQDRITIYYNFIKQYNSSLGITIIIAEFIWLFILTAIPILVIYLPYRISRKKFLMKNLKYEIINHIEYYRDFFQDISPAEISMVTDLELEIEKDIAATLLKLYHRKYIDFNQDKIVIQKQADQNLQDSERALLNLCMDGTLSGLEKANWKNIAINEAINHGLIQENNEKNKKHFWGSTIVFILAIGLVIFSSMKLFQSEFIDEIDEYAQFAEQAELQIYGPDGEKMNDLEKITLLSNDPDKKELWEELTKTTLSLFQDAFLYMLLLAIGIITILAIPFYKLFRKIYYLSIEKSKYRRTPKGEELAEKLAAMQRYIHDFSLLSEVEKEQVRLWDDYLVYAIVLEENQEIVNDISRFKNIEIQQFYSVWNKEN